MEKKYLRFTFGLALVLVLLLTWSAGPGLKALPSGQEHPGKPLLDAGKRNAVDLSKEMISPMSSRFATNYVKLEDINPAAVPEIQLDLNRDAYSSYVVQETLDGFLCGYMAGPVFSGSKFSQSVPRIRKLDKAGNLLWDREYGGAIDSGQINNLLVTPDGSYIFSVQTSPYYRDNHLISEKSFLIKCRQDGEELWKRELDDYSGNLLRHLFLTEKEEIIAVGQWLSNNGAQASCGAADIVVTKLAGDGRILQQKGYGGSDFENLRLAKFDKELGLIILGTTTSRDGEFGIDAGRPYADFVACIDGSLNIKWIVHAQEQENLNFFQEQFALSDGLIHILGHKRGGGDAEVTGVVIQLDKNGNRIWEKSPIFTGLWGRAIAALENGDIVVMASRQFNQGSILILDKSGREKKRLEKLKYAAEKITPTDDGGFILTARREIKMIPQPAYISCLWFDTELLAVKYNCDATLEWRKTYDQYKDTKDLDFAFPLPNGKLITERTNQ